MTFDEPKPRRFAILLTIFSSIYPLNAPFVLLLCFLLLRPPSSHFGSLFGFLCSDNFKRWIIRSQYRLPVILVSYIWLFRLRSLSHADLVFMRKRGARPTVRAVCCAHTLEPPPPSSPLILTLFYFLSLSLGEPDFQPRSLSQLSSPVLLFQTGE